MPLMGSILVTGGAGFLGSNFVRQAVEWFEDVYVLDKLTYAGSRRKLAPVLDQIQFVRGDIRDAEGVRELYESVDTVVNFAAETHVDRSITDGRTFVRSNVEGAYVAMDALRDSSVDRFVQVSTDEVYGSRETGEFDEDDRLDPSSPYSASKASADLFVNSLWETYDLPITIVRPTNVYGPRQHPEKLIPSFILRAIKGKPLPIYGDGTNVRQWLYVRDLCDGIRAVLNLDRNGVYNIAGPTRLSNLEVTKSILRELGASEDLINFVEDRRGHDQRYAISGAKLKEETGYTPEVPFEEGLRRTVRWYRELEDYYDA